MNQTTTKEQIERALRMLENRTTPDDEVCLHRKATARQLEKIREHQDKFSEIVRFLDSHDPRVRLASATMPAMKVGQYDWLSHIVDFYVVYDCKEPIEADQQNKHGAEQVMMSVAIAAYDKFRLVGLQMSSARSFGESIGSPTKFHSVATIEATTGHPQSVWYNSPAMRLTFHIQTV